MINTTAGHPDNRQPRRNPQGFTTADNPNQSLGPIRTLMECAVYFGYTWRVQPAIDRTGLKWIARNISSWWKRSSNGTRQLDYCKVLNAGTCGASVNWWVLPKGRNASEIFDALVAGKLTPVQCQRFFSEIRRLFEKREKMMDRTLDARLGFTTNFGYNPHGIEIPAWKAVFFNPQTSDEIVDRIIYSIDELT